MPTGVTRGRFWGPMYPEAWADVNRRYWGDVPDPSGALRFRGNMYPDPGPGPGAVTPIGPAGAATFVADLDSPMTVTFGWQTDLAKSRDGQERRAAVLDHPKRTFKGSALLIGGASVRTLRAQLARYAARGATFLLGLPFEGVLLTQDAAGAVVFIAATAAANNDWINPGQRVVVMSASRVAVDAVIQSVAGGSVTLDISPGAVAKAGGILMPSVPIVLEPQQGLDRYVNAEGVERWRIDARAVTFGWQHSTGYGVDGNGAVLATHATKSVFDRRINVPDTAGESLQAMNEVIDLGGIPASVGQAQIADWGRHVALRNKVGPEWQWVKKFFAAARGRQRSFWLPTWRKDLDPTASGVNTLTIEGPADADGGFFAWYPTKNAIQVVQADGTVTRATITNAVDNTNGTITLTTGVTLSGSPITMVSWLELCHLESDELAVVFAGHQFSLQTIARVVTR